MTDAPSGSAEQDPRPPLRRSRDHRMISGVCGGLGRCFDMDPVIFRAVLGVLAVAGGLGLIVYGFAWLLVPLEGEDDNEGRRLLSGRVEGQALTALLCALVGCGLFLSMANNSGVMSFALMLTLALLGAVYWSQQHRQAGTEPQEPGETEGAHRPHKAHKTVDAPPETQAPPAPNTPSWWRETGHDGPGAGAARTGYLWGPADAGDDLTDGAAAGTGERGPGARPSGRRPGERATAPAPARSGRSLGGWTFLLALVAGSLGTGLTWNDHPLSTSLEIGLAAALGVFGLGIVVSSRYGRTGGGTAVAAVLTGALLTGAAYLPKSVTADWRERTWRPVAVTDVRAHYELGTGNAVLDLTGLPWSGPAAPAAPVVTGAEIGAGRLRVVLPRDVTATLDIEVGIGDIQLPADTPEDIDVQPRQHKRLTLSPAAGQPSHGTVQLKLEAGIGQVEVDRAA
ncbi:MULTISPECIES: PspC domain-containing protein [Streptomyces]|uniref:PspC domain-containing protein n=1 Tax=Streptomyces luteosporeus TaxID=173856 RepID=A0ABN3TJV8_9ACTN